MAAIDFPDTPTVGQQLTVGDVTWEWTGTVWKSLGTIATGPAGADGADGADGSDAESDFDTFFLMGV
jgi:hypothetical protein